MAEEYQFTVHDIEAAHLIDGASPAQLKEICGTLYLGFVSRLLSYERKDLPLLLTIQASGKYGKRDPQKVAEDIKKAMGIS